MYREAFDAPAEIRQLDGPCGPMAVWMLLDRFAMEASPEEIIERCRYEERIGCFTVCLAEALESFGFDVRFHSDPDNDKQPQELASYAKLERVYPALSLSKLLHEVRQGAGVILFYTTWAGNGHFSPLVGAHANKVLLANGFPERVLKSVFNRSRRAPGILRQALVVRKRG
ncbi:hypothetical protein ACSC9U_11955 [Pseudomonas solani]|uniref:hypothetical protein n=1 Tax=Pseudomonas solani TaxID=2731552 RepID=UPI0003972FFC|nr:hypothetical protein L682_21110 [Pseudomonas alcaligenes OT 69]MDN4147092.1 hypothetical protein [Pseudomonas tohonis]